MSKTAAVLRTRVTGRLPSMSRDQLTRATMAARDLYVTTKSTTHHRALGKSET
jgi:hypothetical protein